MLHTTGGRLTASLVIFLVASCGNRGANVDDLVFDPIATAPVATDPALLGAPFDDVSDLSDSVVDGSSSVADDASAGREPITATGGEWVPASANLTGLVSECGNVALWSDPTTDFFVANVARHGLWAIDPATAEWRQLGRENEGVTNRLANVIVDPEQPEVWWEAGHYGIGGVYRTEDDGETFEQLGDVAHNDFVSVDLGDPDRQTIVVGGHETSTYYVSADGGDSWSEMNNLPDGAGFATAPYVVDDQTFLIGTNGADESGVFRSTDAGETWTTVFDGPISGPVLAQDGHLSWLLHSGGGLITSDDGGSTWQVLPGNGAIETNAAQVIAMPDGSLVTFGANRLVRSSDGGTTWSSFGPPFPYTPNHIAYSADEAAFYASRADCSFTEEVVVNADSIVRLETE